MTLLHPWWSSSHLSLGAVLRKPSREFAKGWVSVNATPYVSAPLATTTPAHEVRRSTIGGAGDTTIPSPGWSPKQPFPRIGLHDLLYGWQACPEFNSFHQGVGQICPREVLFSCRPLSKRGSAWHQARARVLFASPASRRERWGLWARKEWC